MIPFDEALIAQNAPPGAPVLLALSGGADSCAALVLLADVCRRQGRPLSAAHLDHGIRAESADDAAFCARLCAEFGVTLYSRRVDIPALAASAGRGLEETARDARYAFFAEVMAQEKIPVLVTAHHADDNLETILMHFTRGSGLRGLCGIPPVRAFAGGVVVRPLLRAAKADLAGLCEARGIAYRTDSTNADPAYTRNRLRAEVMPVLTALNPAILTRAADAADALRADACYLADAAAALHRGLDKPDRADAAWLREQPTAMRWRLYALLHRAGGGAVSLEQTHLRALDRLLAADSGELSLPGRMTAALWGGEVVFAPAEPQAASLPAGWSIPAQTGWRVLDGGAAAVGIFPDGNVGKNIVDSRINIYKLFINRHLNFDKIKGQLFWRARAPGDTLLWHGHHHAVKKLFQQNHISPADRARLPLLCDEAGVVFLPGVGVRDDVYASTAQGCAAAAIAHCSPNSISGKDLAP